MASTLIRAASAAGLAALLAACAATPQTSRFSDELARLEQDCTARGGVLTPVADRNTPNPALQNYCRFYDGGTRIAR